MLDNLTCARDRLLENYFWVLGIFFEPQNSRARKILTKYWTILTVVDDMYVVYGTYEECKILTDAFQRWDENAVDDLPIILRDFYQKFIQKLVVCYQQELEWCAKGQVPNFNERKKPAIDGNAGAIVVCILLLGFDEVISEEAINWFMSLPDVVMASMEICRYNDEAASYEREMNAGQGPTSIACFMMEHNLKKDEAAIQFEYFTDESWKKMNKAFLCPTNTPVKLLNWVANYARVCSRENLLGFTYSSKLKEPITSLLLKPFSLKN
ncbi:Terpene synthase [Rhynchospora pubera]|uniref:Terpene synthase n=1 Tax=Rhynchospora pubera TaxID=906938 RepID=A0AAV8DRD1_9POAL|nr:Terpene synthase [Rhynchospora pubera]